MNYHAEMSRDAKLKVLIRHLVTTFPHAAILSRPVEETYHLFIIVPYGDAPEKAIQVERAMLVERNPSVHDFACLLDSLNLTTLLEGRDWYDLSHDSWTHPISERARSQSSHPQPTQVLTQRIGAPQLTTPYGRLRAAIVRRASSVE